MAQKRMSQVGRKSLKAKSNGSGVAPAEEGTGSGEGRDGRLIRE